MSPDSIKQMRLQLNLTQQQFAKRLGVTRATVSRWELKSGRYPVHAAYRRLIEQIRAISQ